MAMDKQQDPDDLFKAVKKVFSDSMDNPNRGAWLYTFLIVFILFIIWAVSGIFVVSPAEKSAILRFGRYVTTVGPGPHWIPRFIDSQFTVDTQQVRNFSYQAEMLTRDENIVSVALAVQYRIADPNNYLFSVVDPIKTIQQATSSALRQIVGTMSLDSVLTTGRGQLREEIEKQLVETLEAYKTGLLVTDVRLQPAKPPEAVTDAFDDAIKAREDEQRYINQARAYARTVTSIAIGQIARLQQSADAYQKEVVLQAEGATSRYLALLGPYQQSKAVTRDRLYLDTISNVLANTTNVFVDSSGNNVLYLPLDQLLKKGLIQDRKSSSEKNQADSSLKVTTLPEPNKLVNGYGENRPNYPAGGNPE